MLTTNTTNFKLSEGKTVYGLLNTVPSPWLVEMIGYAGYDFVILDEANREVLVALMIKDAEGLRNCA